MVKMTSDRFVYSFTELDDKKLTSAGGKGGTLSKLYKDGFPVPDGFVIMPNAFDDEDKLLPEAQEQLQDYLKRFQNKYKRISYAVRSSALSEDSAEASFAGEFETVLDVKTNEEFQEAIATVRRSRYSERVKAYSEAKGMDFSHEIAIVVQQLVHSEISGVLFTADPVAGDKEKMTGNFIHGFGDKLVSGEVDAQEFNFSKQKKGKYEGPEELKKYAKNLYKLGMNLERNLGCPQDIEWSIADGRLFLLQSRPLTTFQDYNPVTGIRNISYAGDYLWTNILNAEIYPDVMTPSTWSVWDIILGRLSLSNDHPSFGYIGGRPFVNYSMLNSFLSKIYRDPEKREQLLESTLALPPPGLEIPPFSISWKILILGVIPREAMGELKKKRLKRNPTKFLAKAAERSNELRKKIKNTQNKRDLISIWNKELKPFFLDVFIFQDGMNEEQAFTNNSLKDTLGKLIDKKEMDVLITTNSSSTENLASIGPLIGLSKLKNKEITREEYLHRYGHRGAHENYLSAIRPYEDSKWVENQLAEFEASSIDVKSMVRKRDEEFNNLWQKTKAKLKPKDSKKIEQLFEDLNSACLVREEVRSELTRVIGVIREWFLQAGKLTELGDDIFYLTLDEVFDVFSGEKTSTAYIESRKGAHAKYKALPAPPTWIRGRFDYEKWAMDPGRRTDIYNPFAPLPPLDADASIEGIPGSAGRIEGLVRRIDSPEEGVQLQKGEILVTSTTNVGWTTLFPKAAAVVTDVGAALSHAAIVARELGIPAVVGCGNATMRLKTGDRILVDGGQGVIQILEKS